MCKFVSSKLSNPKIIEVIETIKRFFQKKELKKNLKNNNRYVEFQSVESAKKIGVIYIVEDEASYIRIDNWLKKLAAAGKEVRVVGYHHSDNVPHYCIPKLKHEYYSKKDVNWYGKPIRPSLKDFVEEPFPILIDLTMDENFTTKYILSLSKSSMKVGKKNEGMEDFYDFMISLNEEHDMDDFIYFIETYTKQLKG